MPLKSQHCTWAVAHFSSEDCLSSLLQSKAQGSFLSAKLRHAMTIQVQEFGHFSYLASGWYFKIVIFLHQRLTPEFRVVMLKKNDQFLFLLQ